MARIGIGGFLHETNTFADSRADFRTFVEADAWPGLLIGDEMIAAVSGVNLATDGFIQAARRHHELAPLVWASANPSGPVTRDAFEAMWFLFERALRDAGRLDALFLDLHGAMVTEHLEDGEGEWLRRVRALVGDALPIVVALDFHANITPEMVERATALIVYRSYPHVDMAASGQRAYAVLARLLAGERLHRAYRQVPFIISMPWQSTLASPMAGIAERVRALATAGIASLDFAPGFPLADIPHCGPSIVAYATDGEDAERVVAELYRDIVQRKAEFGGKLHSVDEAVRAAGAFVAAGDGGTLILADTQDNPGGGAPGNTTDLIHALIREQIAGACAGVVCDPAFVQAAIRAGVGGAMTAALGGQGGTGAGPVQARFEVLAVGDGRFVGTGPFYSGCRMDLGPMARVRIADGAGLEIIVSSRKQQAADREMFRHVGADPARYRVLALKSSVHFRADFGSLAREILVVEAPGVNTANLRTLTFSKLRDGVEIL